MATMKTITTTDNSMTWALTESNSDFGKWIISGAFPNIRLKFPERFSSLRRKWEVFRVRLWYYFHLIGLMRILRKIPQKIQGNKESLNLGDQVLVEVYKRLQLIGHGCAAARARGLTMEYSDSLKKELQVLCPENEMVDGICFHTRCYNAPDCDYIQHLISSGNLDEIGNDCPEEDITHIQLILHNEKKGIQFPLLIMRRIN